MLAKIIDIVRKNTFVQFLLYFSISLLVISLFFNYLTLFSNVLDASKIDVLKVFAQFVGGALIFFGLILNKRRTKALEDQVKIVEDSNVTDRFQKAIEHLAHKNKSVRQGGIHSLGRIAKESIHKDSEDWEHVTDLFISYLTNQIKKENKGEIFQNSDILLTQSYLFNSPLSEHRKICKFQLSLTNLKNSIWGDYGLLGVYLNFSSFKFLNKIMIEYSKVDTCDFGDPFETKVMEFYMNESVISNSVLKGGMMHVDIKNSVLSDIEIHEVNGLKFENCTLMNVKFVNCVFFYDIKKCKFHNVHFENCLYEDEDMYF
ncbi:hypothetical protein [Carboxylicivirga marina]|uniref:hypothetical protein n=1 Tax=Carboxylicivirga marina TaxID=2800988 RepID=UPI002596779A|nr:hypothetical protein [uncultured Carboxylicivirga sp.]